MKTVFVIDIDGTLCDSANRYREAFNKHQNLSDALKDFFDGVQNDPPIRHSDLIFKLAEISKAEMVILTGRSRFSYRLTRKWLLSFGFPKDIQIFMRPYVKRHLSPADAKESIFLEHIFKKKVNYVFFEDEEEVCSRYTKYGTVMKSPGCWSVLKSILEHK